jgi:adhesin/invasin
MKNIWRRARFGYVVGWFALLVGSTTCADLTAPDGRKGPVTIFYQGPPIATSGAIQLAIGEKLAPPFRVELGGIAQPRARYMLSLGNPLEASVLRIYGRDSVEVVGRGNATLIATLVGVTVGIDTNTQASVSVLATPASNTVAPTSLTFDALNATKELKGSSLKQDGSSLPLGPNSLVWTSNNPGIADVLKLSDSTGAVTAIANGSTTITATFDGVDVVTVPVTVSQLYFPARSTITPSPASIPADGVSTTTLTVQLRDSLGSNLATGGAIVALASSRGSLSPVTDQGGGAYTATLQSSTAAGTATITGTVNGIAIGNNGIAQFTPGPEAQYVVTVVPNTTPTAGAAVTISAQLADINGNAISASGRVVTWSSTGGGTFSSPTSTTTNGNATVTFTTSTTAQTVHTVTATTGTTSGTSPTITTQSGGPTNFLVTTPNTTPNAGATLTITARLRDGAGNFVRLAGRTVNWSSTNGGTFGSATSTTDGDGIATVSYTVSTIAGRTHSVTATDSASITISGTSPTMTTVAGPTAQLFIATQPSSAATAGVAFAQQPVIHVRDAFGNVRTGDNSTVVTAGRAAGTGALQGTVAVTVVNGVASYTNLRHDVAGTITIQFTVPGVPASTSNNIVVAQGPVSPGTTQITAFPTTIVANGTSTSTITVQARDALGNNLTASAGVVTLSTTLGTLSAVTDNNNGTYTATLTAGNTAGTATINGTIAGQAISDNATVVFSASTATKYVVSAPATAVAGTSILVTAQLTDANNNPVPLAGKTVGWSVSQGPSATFATPTSLTDANGQAVVAFTATVSGNYRVRATDNTLLTGESNVIAVAPGGATHLFIAVQPSGTATAGVVFGTQPVVHIRDAFNNVITTDNSTQVTATRSAGTGTLGGTVTVTAVNGVATFTNLQYTVAETITIAFTSNPALTGATSNSVVVSPAAASHLFIATQPSPTATAGVAFTTQPVIHIRDAFNNVVTGDNTTQVTATRSAGTGTLGGTVIVTAVNGIATFTNLQYTIAETITIAFTSNPALTGATSNNVVVGPGTATHLFIATQPSGTATAGVAFGTQPVVHIRDAFNNVVTTDNTTQVTATASGGTGTLGGTVTVTAANGVATFTNLEYTVAETITIAFTSNPALTGATSNSVVVSPAAASQLFIATQPSPTATAGVAFTTQPVIHIRDAFNNLITGDNTTQVTATRSTGTGALGGTVTVTAVNGVATFTDLQYTVAETITIAFTSNPALTGATSDNVVVSPDVATIGQSTVTANPTSILFGGLSTSEITIQLKDQFGNNTATVVGAVDLTTDAGTLQGTLTNQGGGRYTQLLASGLLTGETATLRGFINSVQIIDTATVSW